MDDTSLKSVLIYDIAKIIHCWRCSSFL